MKYLLLFFSFIAISAGAQTFRFKNYTTEKDGLYPYIYSIHQDPMGFLWLGTGEGLYRFDGINFRVMNARPGEGDHFVNCGLNMGNDINWFGFNDGSLSIMRGSDTLRFLSNVMSGAVVALYKVSNSVFAFSQNGTILLFDYSGNLVQNFSSLTSSMIVLSVSPADKQKFLLGTDDGLYLADLKAGKVQPVDECPVTRVNCIYKSSVPNIWWAGTDDAGVLLLKNLPENNQDRIRIIEPRNINDKITKPVNTIIQDKFNHLWVGTSGEGLFVFRNSENEYSYDHFNLSNGLPADFIKKLFIDKEDNLWIGTYGNGLAKFSDDYFTFHFQGPKNLENNVLSCFSTKEIIFFARNNVLFAGDIRKHGNYSTEMLPVNDRISAVYMDAGGTVWVGFQNSGLYRKTLKSKQYLPFEFNTTVTPGNINYITGTGKKLYVASINGLYVIDTESDTTVHVSTSNGLPHNFISHVMIDMQGYPWIATPTNYLVRLTGDTLVKTFPIASKNDPIKINSVCQDIAGRIWIATYGHGVFCMDDSVLTSFTQTSGLLSNYCYSIVNDESNAIWVGHRQGLSCIKSGVVKQYGKNKDIFLDFNLNAVCFDQNSLIWWGTSNGLVCYDFRKNRLNKVPPGIILESITINEKEFEPADEIELPYGKYKIRFNFTGVSMTEPELMSYSYILEGLDKDWNSHTPVPFALYPGVEDGTYTIRIKAFNSNGIPSSDEAQMTITIAPPVWKRWWFILLAVAVFVYVFYMIIRIRERNHKKLEEYLKRTLDERTLEVRRQKELIELKNKDITDSINYAKRIQEAILPSAAVFRRVLPGAFILYRPRDIVSGDFYVAQSFNDITIVIAADATGHGVPGAFMSLICSTIIKDILAKQSVQSPDAVLYELDREIRQIFTLNEDNPDQPKDGLDITVCEINHRTGMIRISSAMRPFIAVCNGKLIYQKGSKHSIGGGENSPKVFAVNELSVSSGDMLYLFTDGYADQFGGPHVKKFKISGLKKLLTEISMRPVAEQKELLEETFDAWKGEEAQVDDVLVIGIRF